MGRKSFQILNIGYLLYRVDELRASASPSHHHNTISILNITITGPFKHQVLVVVNHLKNLQFF